MQAFARRQIGSLHERHSFRMLFIFPQHFAAELFHVVWPAVLTDVR